MRLPFVGQCDSGQLEQTVMSAVESLQRNREDPGKKSKKGQKYSPSRMGICWGKGSKTASPFPTCQALPSVWSCEMYSPVR